MDVYGHLMEERHHDIAADLEAMHSRLLNGEDSVVSTSVAAR